MNQFHSTIDSTFNGDFYIFTLPEDSGDYVDVGHVHFGDNADPALSTGRTLYTIGGQHRHFLRLGNDGVIRLGKDVDLDHEGINGLTELQFTISAVNFGATGLSYQRTGVSKVLIQDVDETPTLTLLSSTSSLTENVDPSVELTVARFTVNDEDGDSIELNVSPLSEYEGRQSVPNPFELVRSGENNEIVEVRLKDNAVLDYEVYGPSITMTLTATSTSFSVTKQISIAIENVNEDIEFETSVSLDGDDDPLTFSVAENSVSTVENPVLVGKVIAVDGDDVNVTYQFIDPPTDKFEINRDTGRITLKVGAELNHEDVAFGDGSVELLVEASSFYIDENNIRQESVALQNYTINIADVEEAPQIQKGTFQRVEDGSGGFTVTGFTADVEQSTPKAMPFVELNENSLEGVVLASYRVFDPDDGSFPELYTGAPNGLDGVFNVLLVDTHETHGGGKIRFYDVVVNNTALLDYELDTIFDEKTGQAEFVISAESVSWESVRVPPRQADNTATLQLRVVINDVDEQIAFDETTPNHFDVSENSLALANLLEPHTSNSHESLIAPGLDPRSLTDTIIGSVLARDEDFNDEVGYEITGVHSEKFDVNADGMLVLKAGQRLDYESLTTAGDDIELTIEAFTLRNGERLSDEDAAREGVNASVSKSVTIEVTDVDEAPLFSIINGDPINGTAVSQGRISTAREVLVPEVTLDVFENEMGGVLGSVVLRDPENHEIFFVGPASVDSIFTTTLGSNGEVEITLKPGEFLDKESGENQFIILNAMSMNSQSEMKATHLKVNLNIQDAPEVDFTGVTMGTAEFPDIIQSRTAVGTIVGQANATMVAGQEFTFSLENVSPPQRGRLSDPVSFFNIDSATGEITLAKELIQLWSHDIRFQVVATADGQREVQQVDINVNKLVSISDPQFFTEGTRGIDIEDWRESDGDPISLVNPHLDLTTQAGGSLVVDGTMLNYRPAPGFVGIDTSPEVGIRDDRGSENEQSFKFIVGATLNLLEGQTKALTAAMFTGFASGNSTHMQVEFTAIPAGGVISFTAADGSETTITARSGGNAGTVISMTDIAAGRLSYHAPADQDASSYIVPRFEVQDLDADGNRLQNRFGELGDAANGHLTIAVTDLTTAVRTQLADSDTIVGTSNPLLKHAYDLEFVPLGDKVFVVVSGLSESGLSVFEFDPATNDLTFRSQMADSDAPAGTNWGMRVSHGIAHLQKGDKMFVYITGSAEHGITTFELASDGTLIHAHTLIVDYSNDIAMAGVGSMTLVQFDDPDNAGQKLDYMVTSGRYDTGISVFRVEDDGDLTHLARTKGTVTDSNGDTLVLSGESAGTIVKIIQKNAEGSALIDNNGNEIVKTFYIGGLKSLDALAVFEMGADGSLAVRDIVLHSADPSNLELDWPFLGAAYEINGQHYIAVPARDDDGVSIFAIAQDGVLTLHQTLVDDANLTLDKPSDSQYFAFEGEHYLAFTGHDDDGVSLFRIDGSTANLEWVETIRDTEPSGDSTDELLLDGANQIAMYRNGDAVILAVSGINDDGFTLFDIGLDDLSATNAAELL